MGTSGAERGCSWSFFPFLRKKMCLGAWVHAEYWASPAESGRTICFAHTRTPTHQHAVARKLVSTSIFGGVHLRQTRCYLLPFGPPKKEKVVQHLCFLFQDIYSYCCFSRAALDLLVFRNQSAPSHVANNVPFGSLQCRSPRWFKWLTSNSTCV